MPAAPRDPADEAMCARARERFAGDRGSRFRRRRKRHAELPNLIIVGGLKCGTTSIHHYLGLHPEIQMSKPKELNFFARELNWDLGLDWYASRFDDRFEVRGESSPHYTNLPRFEGVPARIKEHCPDARLLYMVRDPIKRILSHWVHATGAGYETRELVPTLSQPDSSYIHRSLYWMQLQPYLELFDRSQIEVIAQEELQAEREETMRKAFRFAGVDEGFTSEQFDREWEKSSAKQGDKYQVMERAGETAGPALLRPQLRPPARVAALDRREGRPRPGEAAGAEARAPRRPLRDGARLASAPTSPPCRSSPAASSPAGTTTPERLGLSRQGFHLTFSEDSWRLSAGVAAEKVQDVPPLPGQALNRLQTVRLLLPNPGPTTIGEQLDSYRPREEAGEDRPFVAMNFAATVDGRAAIGGVSGPIGSAADTAMLAALRTRFDAVMIGAGTMRAERYGEIAKRLVVVESGPEGRVDLPALLRSLREEGVRALLCEGGPTLHGALQAAGLVDDIFLTIAPKLSGGDAPRILEGDLPEVAPLELAWLLEEDGELFARYRRR